jgi:hypothetical protein
MQNGVEVVQQLAASGAPSILKVCVRACVCVRVCVFLPRLPDDVAIEGGLRPQGAWVVGLPLVVTFLTGIGGRGVRVLG